MSRRSISPPLAFTAVFVVLVALLVTGALPSPMVVAETQCNKDYLAPAAYDNCLKTQTAEASTGGGSGGGNSSPSATPTPTSTAALTVTRTLTPTQILTPTLGAPAATPTVAPQQAQTAPEPTPTPALPEGVAALVCVPGASVNLVGRAAPGTPLLAYFDGRPVGGGFSRADGGFSIDLLIGDERPGLYLVEVRERESLALVGQFGCEVPGGETPTPTP